MRCVECKSKKEVTIELGEISSVDSVNSEKRDPNSSCMGACPDPPDDPRRPFLEEPTHPSSETYLKTPFYVQPDNPSPEELLATANNDQKALRKLLNNADMLKEIKKYLDQQADRNRDKPTFIQLAEFMKMDDDRINNLIYCCTREAGSPTEELLRLMCMAGHGINYLYSFLEKYPSLHELKESINSSFLPPE
ncbi:uncharacterized protein LOC131935095 [Physella acuta]|uniref:uncharacterized protein LOC131935095 n=1 Tax=Physella acuta TaxID=109671 RepID=UPI0027DC01A9|nr:uncharacterized protein LOC131935095 [Physella acuta]